MKDRGRQPIGFPVLIKQSGDVVDAPVDGNRRTLPDDIQNLLSEPRQLHLGVL